MGVKKMWRLVCVETGNIARSGMQDQWEALRLAVKYDGSRYKKKEALEVPSGTKILKSTVEKKEISYSPVRMDGGFDAKVYTKTIFIKKVVPFILEEY